MKVKLYAEGLEAWKSRQWITNRKEFGEHLDILIGGMLRSHEYTFFIECRVCGRPLCTTYKVVQLRTDGFYSFDVDTEDEARDMVSRLSISGLLHAPIVPSPEIHDNTMNAFKAFFKKL